MVNIMLSNIDSWRDLIAAREDDEAEAKAIMQDAKFEDGFNELQRIDDKIFKFYREFNLILKYLQDNPPADTSMLQWNELKGLKPFPVNEY